MRTLEKILLTGIALITLGAGLVGGACKRDYDVTPTELPAIHTPVPSETTVTEPSPIVTPVPEPEIVEPYKLYAPTATPEESNNFNSALDKAWGIVKNVYGMEPNGQIIVYITEKKLGYGIAPKSKVMVDLNIPVSDSGSYPIRDFLADQEKERGIKHELAHRFNETLFPTYHSWFDEGLSMYASGEVDNALSRGMEKALEEIENDSYKYFIDYKQRNPNVVPGHVIGNRFFGFLIWKYGMTPEQNREALSLLNQKYLEKEIELPKADIKEAYESALEVSLDSLFDLLKPSIMLLYSTDPKIAGTEGYKINQKIRSEF